MILNGSLMTEDRNFQLTQIHDRRKLRSSDFRLLTFQVISQQLTLVHQILPIFHHGFI